MLYVALASPPNFSQILVRQHVGHDWSILLRTSGTTELHVAPSPACNRFLVFSDIVSYNPLSYLPSYYRTSLCLSSMFLQSRPNLTLLCSKPRVLLSFLMLCACGRAPSVCINPPTLTPRIESRSIPPSQAHQPHSPNHRYLQQLPSADTQGGQCTVSPRGVGHPSYPTTTTTTTAAHLPPPLPLPPIAPLPKRFLHQNAYSHDHLGRLLLVRCRCCCLSWSEGRRRR